MANLALALILVTAAPIIIIMVACWTIDTSDQVDISITKEHNDSANQL